MCSKSPWSWWQSIAIFLTTNTNLDKLCKLIWPACLPYWYCWTLIVVQIYSDQSWQGNMAGLSPCAWRGIQPLEGFRSARLGLNIDHRLKLKRGWRWCWRRWITLMVKVKIIISSLNLSMDSPPRYSFHVMYYSPGVVLPPSLQFTNILPVPQVETMMIVVSKVADINF